MMCIGMTRRLGGEIGKKRNGFSYRGTEVQAFFVRTYLHIIAIRVKVLLFQTTM
jgi:hypothetical protein